MKKRKYKSLIYVLVVLSILLTTQACSTTEKTLPVSTSIDQEQASTIEAVKRPITDRSRILNLLIEGKPEEAIDLLEQIIEKDVTGMKKNAKGLQANYLHGIIRFEDYNIQSNKLNHAIYELLPPREHSVTYVSHTTINSMLEEDKIDQAIELLLNAGYDGMSLLKARTQRAQRAYRTGTITAGTLNVNYARAKQSFHYYMENF